MLRIFRAEYTMKNTNKKMILAVFASTFHSFYQVCIAEEGDTEFKKVLDAINEYEVLYFIRGQFSMAEEFKITQWDKVW